MMKLKLLVGVGIPAFLWVALFLSGFGILVEEDVYRNATDCSYFVGTEIVSIRIESFTSPAPSPLKCPRWHRLGG
jgi:hypothetical protein